MTTPAGDSPTDQPPALVDADVGHTGGDTPTTDWVPTVGDYVAVAAAGLHDQTDGRIIEDFGEFEAHSVDANDTRISDPARRWAVATAAGDLIFVDTDQLTPAAPSD